MLKGKWEGSGGAGQVKWAIRKKPIGKKRLSWPQTLQDQHRRRPYWPSSLQCPSALPSVGEGPEDWSVQLVAATSAGDASWELLWLLRKNPWDINTLLPAAKHLFLKKKKKKPCLHNFWQAIFFFLIILHSVIYFFYSSFRLELCF